MAEQTSSTDRKLIYPENEALTEKEIRVLEFASPDDDILRLHMRTIPLAVANSTEATNLEPYLTLSYTWGDQTIRHPILINNIPFQVGKNLFQALSHLKSKIKLPIWIDAICINQENDREKNVQVGLMGHIYSMSQETFIWLGEGDASIGKLFAAMDQLGEEAIDAGIWDLDLKDKKLWTNPEVDSKTIEIRSRIERMMRREARGSVSRAPFPIDDLIELSLRPWFSRVWILQEIANANQYTFLCSGFTVPGDHFTTAFLFCSLWIGREIGRIDFGGSFISILYGLLGIWWRSGWRFINTFRLRILDNKQLTLSPRAATTIGTRRKVRRDDGITLIGHLTGAFTVTSAAAIEASEPKDRIYGLLGISSDKDALGLEIDYSHETPFQQVYIDTARALIREGHLEIILLCRSGYSRIPPYEKLDRSPNLPSWVPDWTQPLSRPWGGAAEDKLFSASGETRRTSEEQNTTSDMLTIRTRFVDTIADLGTTWSPQWDVAFNYVAAANLIVQLDFALGKSGERYDTEQRKEAAWRIPIADQEFDEVGRSQRATAKSQQSYDLMRAFLLEGGRTGDATVSMSYLSAMKDVHDAAPFLARTGYAGLCPGGTVAGDEIHIPFGLHVPVVLRKVGARYKLIGEAYVHGVMDGELFKTDLLDSTDQLLDLI